MNKNYEIFLIQKGIAFVLFLFLLLPYPLFSQSKEIKNIIKNQGSLGSKSIEDVIDINNPVIMNELKNLKKEGDNSSKSADIKENVLNNIQNDISNNNLDNKDKIEAVDSKTILKEDPDQIDNDIDEDDNNITENEEKERIGQQEKSINPANVFFGYNAFSGNPELLQDSESYAIDPSYLIGPGDDVVIMLWGDAEMNENFTVSIDGYLFIENIGRVFVNGLNLEQLETKLFNLLKRVYSSLDPVNGNSSTFFDVSLGSLVLRPLRIFALGEVRTPGAYEVRPTTTFFTSLFYFRGPTNRGSLRDIRLMRNGKQVANIDFYDYLSSGNTKNSIS